MSADEFEFSSQWAILPARVRYDQDLPPNAKLLFAEIAAKTNTMGFCWAHNKWFSEKLALTCDRVSALIKTLEEAGYIIVDVDPARENAERRRIYIAPEAFVGGIGKNADTPYRQKCRDGIGKNADTLKYKNKKGLYACGAIEISQPKHMQLAVFQEIGQYCGDDGELMLAYMGWAEMRNKIHKPIASIETVTRANRKLDKASGGRREYKIGMLHKATDSNWTGLFPLKPGDEGYEKTEKDEREGKYELWT